MMSTSGCAALKALIRQQWNTAGLAIAISSSSVAHHGGLLGATQARQVREFSGGLETSSQISAMPMTMLEPHVDACSALESLLFVLSPAQMAAQLLNVAHSATGLPWWASIPLTTIAVRTALLPLSLRAKSASANFILFNNSLEKSRIIRDKLREGTPGMGGIGMWTLARQTHKYARRQHEIPSFNWYILNGLVQASAFVSLTYALKHMSSALWPGFNTEGILYFKDLTAPPVYLETLTTPCGTLGAVLPLAMVLLYISSIDLSAGARIPGIITALRLAAVPYYCASLIQPHATLLCWSTVAVSHYALQAAMARPGAARLAGMPAILLPPQTGMHDQTHADAAVETASASTAGTAGTAGESESRAVPNQQGAPLVDSGSAVPGLSGEQGDAELLVHLGQHYGRRRKDVIAAACYKLALQVKPDCPGALSGLQLAAADGKTQLQ